MALGNKQVNQGGIGSNGSSEEKYGQIRIPQKIEFAKFMINIDTDTQSDVKDYILNEKIKGKKMYDLKTGKDKEISMSSWLRKVIRDELQRNGYYEEKAKREAEKNNNN